MFAVAKEKDNKTIELAKQCSPQDFYRVDQNTLWYKSKYFIYLEPRNCSCAWFLEHATCKHQVFYVIMWILMIVNL